MINEQELYKICDIIAKKFFRKNYLLCSISGYDINDLKQEAKFYAWKIIKKYPDVEFEDLKKLVSQASLWRLKAIKKYVLDINFKKLMKFQSYLEKDNNENNKKSKKQVCIPREKLYNINMFSDELHKICSEREFKILYEIIVNNRSLREVAKMVNLSHAGVKYIYDKTIPKIQQFYPK